MIPLQLGLPHGSGRRDSQLRASTETHAHWWRPLCSYEWWPARQVRLLLLVTAVSALVPALGAEALRVCGTAEQPVDGGCWQPLKGKPDCHVWNANPQPIESAAFEGRSRCRRGKLSGTGTLTWTWREDDEVKSGKHTGAYSGGKGDGEFAEEFASGSRGMGRYVAGERQGDWVFTFPPGTEGEWDRMEGPYLDGKMHGSWRLENYDSDGTLIDQQSGPYVAGEMQGDWVEVLYEEIDGLSLEGQRNKGPFAGGKRHGGWSITATRFNYGSVTRIHEQGSFVEGTKHGPWVEVSYDLNQRDVGQRRWAPREARPGDMPSDHRRSEGSFLEGKRDGQWVTVEHLGDVVLRDDGAHVDGESSIRTEGSYSGGEKKGAWRTVSSDGISVTENFVGGKRHGEYEARERDGSLLIAARAVEGEVTEISLPKAMPSPLRAEGSEYAPVVGAFGIVFGDINQLKSLTCSQYSTCLTQALWSLNTQATGRRPSFFNQSIYLDRVPNPIARSSAYFVNVSPHVGIARIGARLEFESEAESEEEASRINGLLREKYGKCRDYRLREEIQRVAGQCDANGLSFTSVRASSHGKTLYLKYELLSPAERERLIAAWRERGEVRGSDL